MNIKTRNRKMKKIIAILLLLATAFSLVACKKDDGIPDGMQIVRGGEQYGYYMYAPEEWTVSNYGEISTAYASRADMSSVSYVELPMPEVPIAEYFAESLGEFPEISAVKVIVENEEITFGNADSAVKYVFEHTYTENIKTEQEGDRHSFRTMQVFVSYGERFGIFNFTSPLENISSGEKLQYDYYEEKIADVIKYFKFIEKQGTAEEPQYTTDADGYRLVSDKSIVKYSLYLPEDAVVEHSSGITVATLADSSSITLSAVSGAGVTPDEYWQNRKNELSEIVTDIKEISTGTQVKLGNSRAAWLYEYTFVYNNTTYHIYQVLAITVFSGYVFTYTAAEENYAANLETVAKISEKVTLRW
jgi:hypothetical protein